MDTCGLRVANPPKMKRWSLWSTYPVESNITEDEIRISAQSRQALQIQTKAGPQGRQENCRTLNQYRLSSSTGGHLKRVGLGQSKASPFTLLSLNICSNICFQWTLMQLEVPRAAEMKDKT